MIQQLTLDLQSSQILHHLCANSVIQSNFWKHEACQSIVFSHACPVQHHARRQMSFPLLSKISCSSTQPCSRRRREAWANCPAAWKSLLWDSSPTRQQQPLQRLGATPGDGWGIGAAEILWHAVCKRPAAFPVWCWAERTGGVSAVATGCRGARGYGDDSGGNPWGCSPRQRQAPPESVHAA